MFNSVLDRKPSGRLLEPTNELADEQSCTPTSGTVSANPNLDQNERNNSTSEHSVSASANSRPI